MAYVNIQKQQVKLPKTHHPPFQNVNQKNIKFIETYWYTGKLFDRRWWRKKKEKWKRKKIGIQIGRECLHCIESIKWKMIHDTYVYMIKLFDDLPKKKLNCKSCSRWYAIRLIYQNCLVIRAMMNFSSKISLTLISMYRIDWVHVWRIWTVCI